MDTKARVLFCDSLVKLVTRCSSKKKKLGFACLDIPRERKVTGRPKDLASPVTEDIDYFNSDEQYLYEEKAGGIG